MKTLLKMPLIGMLFSLLILIISCHKEVIVNENKVLKSTKRSLSKSTMSIGPLSLKVVTYNIHHGVDRSNPPVNKLQEISDLIEGLDADVVLLQEVDKNTVRSGNVDQMAWLATNTLGMSNYTFEKHYDYDSGEYGLGILSKYPLSEIRNNRIPNNLAMLTAKITLNDGRQVAVASAHFSGDDVMKLSQANSSLTYLRYYSNLPIFFGGDLNSVPGSAVLNNLLGLFDDTENRYSNPITDYYTFPAHSVPDTTYRKKLDYILVSKAHISSVTSKAVVKTPNPTRDHHPFEATVELKGSLFTAGNLLISRYGNGSALSGQTTEIYIDEYTTAGTLIRTLSMPTTTTTINGVQYNKRLTGIGTSTHEGLMTTSRDGRSVSLMGYDLTAGVTPPSPITQRVVGIISADGVINTYTSTGTDIGSTRCVTSIDGSAFWMVGSSGNIRYLPMGINGTGAVNLGGPSGSRSMYLFDNNDRLYLSTTISGTRIARVGTSSTPPTSGSQTLGNFPGYPTATTSPNQFVMFDTGTNNTPDILYVADDSAGSILKYTYNGTLSQWQAQGSVSVPNIKSITGKIVSGTVTLYVTSIGSPSYLKKITNASGTTLSGATVTTLNTAPVNTVFKSVAYAPSY